MRVVEIGPGAALLGLQKERLRIGFGRQRPFTSERARVRHPADGCRQAQQFDAP